LRAKKLATFILPALVIIAIDQWSKFLVRTRPDLQNWDIIPGWLSFHYTLNPGMALGIDWLSTPVVSVISIIAVLAILGYVFYTMPQAGLSYLFCMGLVMGGAFGNIIDRLIMAKIGGYGGVLEGHVIDFIHFTPTIQGYPVFPYIFNVADMAISVAFIALLIFHRQILPEDEAAHE
jgi:signal peptidase II